MQAFIKAIELNSSNPDALFNLGQLISTEDALKRNESDEEREKTAEYAVELLNKAVTLNPSQLEWKVKLAGALLQAGQKDALKNVLEFILNQKADIPEVYFIRSRIKRGIEAYKDLKKSLVLKNVKRIKYPNFYNSVISQRIYDALELNENEPYLEISTVSESSTFLAKKAKMYEEEKKVANKAPVDGISVSNLNVDKKKVKKKQKKKNFRYIIKVADFYYENSANNMKKRITDELNLNNTKIDKISNTNFRVYFGPYDNLKSLKNAYNDIYPLNFENIEILKL